MFKDLSSPSDYMNYIDNDIAFRDDKEESVQSISLSYSKKSAKKMSHSYKEDAKTKNLKGIYSSAQKPLIPNTIEMVGMKNKKSTPTASAN